MENAEASMILKELREFRTENNKRWNENDKRWEENNKRWNENDKRWEENDNKWETTEKRLLNLEKGRQKDREDLLKVLDTMQQSITNQFVEMKNYIDEKFEKISEFQIENEKEHAKFRQAISIHEKRVNFQNSRIQILENWKEEMENGAILI